MKVHTDLVSRFLRRTSDSTFLEFMKELGILVPNQAQDALL